MNHAHVNSNKFSHIGQSIPHESAHLHVSGQATYIDDLPEWEGTLHVAVGLSTCAHGRITKLDLSAVREAAGVRCVYLAEDIPHDNNCGPIVADEPIIAHDVISFYGQVIFVVAADTYEQARAAVRLAITDYEVLEPILTIQDAIQSESWVLPPVDLTCGDVQAGLNNAPHRLQGTACVGGQEHFYLEGQVSYAYPKEDHSIHIHCSTQHPTEMQNLICHALGYRAHQVSVEARRMGGGFGGKESQSAQWACIAALLAVKTGKPVKVRLDRDDDMVATGKRHGFEYAWDVGFDAQGRILGLSIQLASNCGFSVDLSGPVNDRAICHVDNAYYLDALSIRSLRCKTHTVSNTAFRGFGGPQGMFPIEYVMDDIAYALELDPLDVRIVNFYDDHSSDQAKPSRNITPYGTTIVDNVIPTLINELTQSCDYRARRAAIQKFNAGSPIIKKGLALTPVKFGISFNATLYNQAGALVHVYSDGTVLVNHGGTEMGQGLYSKIRQIVAHEFGLPLDDVRFSATDTSRVPNTSATAASSGTDLNGKAAQAACIAIRTRLAILASELNHVDVEHVCFSEGMVIAGNKTYRFAELVSLAYQSRIQLWDSGFYKTPDIHWNPTIRYGRPFYYFAYGASATEVAIDTLTGETSILRVDILHDVGQSINPAIDIGQIEGGFIQGMGWLTSEELYWVKSGTKKGHLFTHAPSTYKIPTAADCPEIFNVHLFQNENVENTIHRSKAVGEPPFMLSLSVFLALRDAVSAAVIAETKERPKLKVSLDAPATPENILRAIYAGKNEPFQARP